MIAGLPQFEIQPRPFRHLADDGEARAIAADVVEVRDAFGADDALVPGQADVKAADGEFDVVDTEDGWAWLSEGIGHTCCC